MTDDFDWVLLTRYLSGECTAEERQAIERWLETRPERRRELGVLSEAWDRAAVLPIERDAPEALGRLAARVGPGVIPTPRRRPATAPRIAVRRQPVRAFARLLPVAAALMIAAGVTLIWRHVVSRTPATAAPAEMREYRTARAQRAVVRLSDGTRVILAPDTRLRLAAAYGRASRIVLLEGAAHFTVEHDASRPFLVHAGGTVAEDLGTEFVVRAYPDDRITEVGVARGRVALQSSMSAEAGRADAVALSPGQLARVERSGMVTVTSGVDMERLSAWTRGRLEFRRAPLGEVRRELERWYDLRIEWSDSTLAEIAVTATFDDRPAKEVIGRLARLLGARYTWEDSTVRLITSDSGSSR